MRASSLHITNLWPLVGLAILLGVAPLFYFGGVFTWFPCAGALAALTAIAWCVVWMLKKRKHHTRLVPSLSFTAPMLLFAIPIAAGVFQLLPMGENTALFSPESQHIWDSAFQGMGRISIAPYETLRVLKLLFVAWIVYLFSATYSRYHIGVRIIAFAIIFAAVGNALVGIIGAFQMSAPQSDSDILASTLTVCNGVFMNRNHFGFFLNLGLFMMASGVIAWNAGRRNHSKYSLDHDSEKYKVPTRILWAVLALFLMMVALFASLSRGASMAFLAGSVLMAAVWIIRRRRSGVKSYRNIIIGAIFLIGSLLWALPAIISKLSNRFNALLTSSLSDDTRSEIWQSTWELIGKYWLSGTGLGGYGDAIQRLPSVTLTDVLVEHAHNDWLEAMAEMGLPVMIVMVGVLVYVLWHSCRRLRHQHDPVFFWFGCGACAAMTAMVIHECFDFNLQAGPNLMAAAAMLGILDAAGKAGRHHHHSSEKAELGVAVALLLVMVLLVTYCVCEIPGAWCHDRLWTMLQPEYTYKDMGKPAVSTLVSLAESTLEKVPDSPAVKLRLARLLYRSAFEEDELTKKEQLSLIERSRELLMEARRGAPSRSEIILWQAIVAETLKQYDQAEKFYRQLTESAPTLAVYRRRCAEAALRTFRRQRTEEHRQRALADYSGLLNILPEQIEQLLPCMMELSKSTAELLEHCPLTAQTVPALFKSLIMQRQHATAGALLEACAQQQELLSQPEFRSEFDSARMLLARLTASPRMGEWWESWKASRLAAQEAAVAIAAEPAGGSAEALPMEVLQPLAVHEGMTNYSAVLLIAEKWLNLGQADEMVAAMMPFAYAAAVPPTVPQLRRAMELLTTPAAVGEKMNTRWIFLRNALTVILAESPEGNISATALRRCRQELQGLDSSMKSAARAEFFQAHLIPYFCARASHILHEPQQVIAGCRECLARCPRHIGALELLNITDRGALTKEQRELIQCHPSAECSVIAPGILLRRVLIDVPGKMTLSTPISIKMFFQCIGNVSGNGLFTFELEDSRGAFVRKNMGYECCGSDAVRWVNGEGFSVECQFDLPLTWQVQAHGTPRGADKKVYLRISAQEESGALGKSSPEVLRAAYVIGEY